MEITEEERQLIESMRIVYAEENYSEEQLLELARWKIEARKKPKGEVKKQTKSTEKEKKQLSVDDVIARIEKKLKKFTDDEREEFSRKIENLVRILNGKLEKKRYKIDGVVISRVLKETSDNRVARYLIKNGWKPQDQSKENLELKQRLLDEIELKD